MDAQEPVVTTITPAEAVTILDQAERLFQMLRDLGRIAQNASALQNLEGVAIARQRQAADVADQAERDTAEKLALFDTHIKRASEESDRILAKAAADSQAAFTAATEEADGIRAAAQKSKLEAQADESAARARTAELTRVIAYQEATLTELTAAIAAAQEKIANFSK